MIDGLINRMQGTRIGRARAALPNPESRIPNPRPAEGTAHG